MRSDAPSEKFVIREIDRSEQSLLQVFDVCRDSFESVNIAKLTTNWLSSHPESTFIGAYFGSELAAVNGFLAHPVLIDGVRGMAFQSCWSATRSSFRGKGLFTKIINTAKSLLSGRGQFIFGFPNEVSGPIFTGKLGFRMTPMRRVVMGARGGAALLGHQISASRLYESLSEPLLVRFDQHACAAWKVAEHGERLVQVEHNTNFLWGIRSQRRILGSDVSTLLVGGCEINKPKLMGRLIQQAYRASGALLLRFVCAEGSAIANAGRFVVSGSRTEPFIHFPLSNELGGIRFDAHVGLKDVF